MKNISERLGTAEYAKALAEFTLEQPNLQKLLTEVKYTRQDTYRFFIEMATKCTDLIERFMGGKWKCKELLVYSTSVIQHPKFCFKMPKR